MPWILTAFVGALLGWCFVQTFFFFVLHPVVPVRVGPWTWQGLLPRWLKHNLVPFLEKSVRSLQPGERIRERLSSMETRTQAERWLIGQADQYLTETVPAKWPMIALLIGEKTQDKVRQALTQHLSEHWQSNIDTLSREQLSDPAIAGYLQHILHTDDQTGWFNRIREILAGWKSRMLVFSMLAGAALALLGKLLYQLLLNI